MTTSDPESKDVEGKEKQGKAFGIGLWVLLIVATISTAGVLIAGYRNVELFKSLGSWGDFAGGLLNPILTFITFLALILTLWLQRQELGLTREEMTRSANALEGQGKSLKKQSFERTFFEMMSPATLSQVGTRLFIPIAAATF